MNGLTTDLAAAQRQVSPRYRLTAEIYNANAIGKQAGTEWETFDSLPANLDLSFGVDYWQVAACGFGDYIAQAYLNWNLGRLDFRIFDPNDEFDYSHNVIPLSTFSTGGYTPCPAITNANGTLYLFYILPTNALVYRTSADGSTWSGETTIAAAASSIAAIYNASSNTVACLFNDGSPNIKIVAKTGAGSWVTSSAHSTTANWVVSGITAVANSDNFSCYFHIINANFENITAHTTATMNDSTLTSWGALSYINVVSGDGAIHWDTVRVGVGFNDVILACREVGVNHSWLACGGFVAAALPQEPQIVASDDYEDVEIFFHPAQTDNDITVLLSHSYAYRSYHTTTDTIYTLTEKEIIDYTYDVGQNTSGKLRMILPRIPTLSSLQAGVWLRLTRHCDYVSGSSGGSVSLLFRILRVRSRREYYIIEASDAAGLLGNFTPRRSKLFRPSDNTLQVAVQQAAAWLGVYVEVQESIADNYERLQWQPMENGLSFLQRMQLFENFRFRTRDTGSNTPTIQVIAVSSTSQITYSTAEGETYHHVYDYESDSNLLSRYISVAHGLFDDSSPGDGEELFIVLPTTTAVPGDFRVVRYYLNRYMSEPDLQQIANASGDHLTTKQPAYTIETRANLALEPFDKVSFGSNYYVLRIVEQWRRGILTQRVSLTTA